MGKKVKLGIVGCGGHMFEFMYNALKWAPPVEVLAVCDPDAGRLDRFTSFYNVPNRYESYREMFDKEPLDAVIVIISEQLHGEVAKAAMLAGIDVFVEKTPCRSTQEAEELVRIQRQTGKRMMVGFNRRYMTAYAMAKEISQREEFGPVRMYQSQFHTTPYRSEAYFKLNHVIHHLDLARYLMGEIRLTQVQRVALDDQRVGYTISFVSEAGGIGTIQSGSLLDELYPMERLELVGNRRNVVVDNVKSLVYNRPPGQRKEIFQPFRLLDEGDALVWNPSHGVYPRYSHHGYENVIHSFVESVANRTRPEPTIEDSLHTMKLLDEMEALLAVQAAP